MKKFVSFLIMSSMTLSFYASANTNVKSKLFIQQNDETSNEIKDNNKVDFFELAKKNEQPLPTPNWDSSDTVNMSQHDRSQYLFNQRNYSALNHEVNIQRADALKKARDDGKISNKKYHREVQNLKMYNQPKGPGSVGFSIPWE